jgi:APA family basic amino acid/polyamine antiporter
MSEHLRRTLSIFEIILFSVGIIVGAGIYSLIGEAAGAAGNGVWLSVVFAGITTILTGISFAEMSSMFPQTTGYYMLLREAFREFEGKTWGFSVEWMMIAASIFAMATISIAFAQYLSFVFPVDTVLVSILLIVISGLISYIGIRESVKIALLLSIAEIAGLIIVIILGVFFTRTDFSKFTDFHSFKGVFLGASLIFFAYTGFELIPAEAEETKSSRKTVPKAIVISILISMTIYVLVSVAVMNMGDPSSLKDSLAPLSDILGPRFGTNISTVVWFSALLATAGTVIGVMVTSSRLIYGLARARMLPSNLSTIEHRHKTPYIAIVISVIFSSAIIFIFKNLTTAAELANLMNLVTFMLVNVSIVILRFYKPHLQRDFKVPFSISNIPILPIIATVLIGFIIYQFSAKTWLYGFGIIIIGMFIYGLVKNHIIE